jgi:actin-like ATPase involved in cell morphogenesis
VATVRHVAQVTDRPVDSIVNPAPADRSVLCREASASANANANASRPSVSSTPRSAGGGTEDVEVGVAGGDVENSSQRVALSITHVDRLSFGTCAAD